MRRGCISILRVLGINQIWIGLWEALDFKMEGCIAGRFGGITDARIELGGICNVVDGFHGS